MNWLKRLFGFKSGKKNDIQAIEPTPHWHICHRKTTNYNDEHLEDEYTVMYGEEIVSVFDNYSDAYEMAKELFDNNVNIPYKGYSIRGYISLDMNKKFEYEAVKKGIEVTLRMPKNKDIYLSCKDIIKAIDNEEIAKSFKEDININ